MTERLLTSAEVAKILGVTAGSVKRWTDLGLLRCARTGGRHRRFDPVEVDRFRKDQTGEVQPEHGPDVEGWLDLLLSDADAHQLLTTLYSERARLGAWWKVAESLAAVLEEMGERWTEGSLSILEEHMASERLSRILAQVSDQLPSRPGAPRLLLTTAEGEEHTLGLSLAEMVIREHGWPVLWAGRRVPLPEIVAHVASGAVDAVAVAASSMADPGDLLAQTERLGAICRAGEVHLLLGGSGPWPEWIPYGARVVTFQELRGWLKVVESGSAPDLS
ncbi:MAG: helix-turn-helix domain-containing protein [Deltaproteobacteria bacterium]|nr:helix-turn-helix domain-containing protein [Deltaproteobacteria bacterium]